MQVVERLPAQGLSDGERTLLLRSLPKQALVNSARLRLTPVDAAGAVGASIDPVAFAGAAGGGISIVNAATGETKTRFANGEPPWVEIDFHKRRTLVDVTGANLTGTRLQVDFGGTFVEVNQNGSIRVGDGDSRFTLAGGGALPGLAVSRFRLTAPTAASPVPDITQVRLRNVATNVTVAFDSEPPFWARPGDLVTETVTADFAEALQAALGETEAADGLVEIALVVHSDSPARIDIAAEIDFEAQIMPLGESLPEATLPYAYNGTPEADAALLAIEVPLGSRVKASGTHANVVGRFDNSKIVFGGLERVNGSPAAAAIEETVAVAQPFAVPADLTAHAVDLLLATSSASARLQVDLRGDLDGKPGAASLLPDTASFAIDNKTAPTPRWTSVLLPAAFKATALDPITGGPRRYWLVVQSAEGGARWSVAAAAGAPAVRLQQSRDGGMSWREAVVAEAGGVPAAQFRLRQQTTEFDVPIEVEVGVGEGASRIGLGQFRPLGRIDFNLDAEALANAFNGALDAAEQGTCRRAEQLVNGDFELDASPDPDIFLPLAWTPSGDDVRLVPSGGHVFVILGGRTEAPAPPPVSISQVVPAAPGCTYELSVAGATLPEGGRAELIWRGEACAVVRTDRLALPAPPTAGVVMNATFSRSGGAFGLAQVTGEVFLPTARLRVTAPEGANQVEVRLLAPEMVRVIVDRVSLTTGPQSLLNGDLHEVVFGAAVAFVGWSFDPSPAETGFALQLSTENGRVRFDNDTGLLQPLGLVQRAAAAPGASFALDLTARSVVEAGAAPPSVRLTWLDGAGAAVGAASERRLVPEAADRQQIKGTVPADAAEAEVRLVIPDRASLVIEQVALEQLPSTAVPMVILSAAPGALTIGDFAVAVEPTSAPPIAMPATGLCQPTPAELDPEDICEVDLKTCDGHAKPAAAPSRMLSRQPIGTLSPAERLTLMRAGEDSFIAARRVRTPVTERLVVAARGTPSLRVLTGIGPERERILGAAGILTVRDVADLQPSQLEDQIEVSPRQALNLVNQARALVGRPAFRTTAGVRG